ncbi:TonB-dependent receptor domain-containing protein [uncultured Parabacteroides sp.]|mgnify:CR=1 FL=1|uniref:TonB-dependent receptor domain-containing protein n=2 Tax=uncultured Parabacteroides sp. TaxID=512312 RepID=UPI0035A70DA7
MKKVYPAKLFARVTMVVVMMMLALSALQAQTRGADETRKVTLNMQKASMREILDEIQKQTGVTFSYESSLLRELPKTSFKAESEALPDCLKRLFANQPVVYKLTGNVVILKRKPKQVTVSGFVRDAKSAESLIGASVYEAHTRMGTASNNFGFFSLTLPAGEIKIQASYIGYGSLVYDLEELDRDTTLAIDLVPTASLQEVVVTGAANSKQSVLSTQMGALEIDQKTINATPVMFGEADIIKTLQLTPGVSAGTEGTAGMYVRGGNVDENLFLIDGNPVYQINHIGGVFSAFNSEAISGMDFFKAGFPARYGGRLSSVVDVHTKEGNMREYHGSATLGLISGNLNLEGPIIKDRTSFQIALRRTWLDVLTAPAIAITNGIIKKDGSKVRGRYAFHDLNLKINHRFSDRSRMYLSLYNGNDVLKGGGSDFSTSDDEKEKFRDDTDISLRWGNLMATAGWTYVFNNQLFGKVSGVFTRYHSKLKNTEKYVNGEEGDDEYYNTFNETSTQTGIMDVGLRTSFDYLPLASHHIRFGGDYLLHRFRPEYNEAASSETNIQDTTRIGKVFANDLLWAHEAGVFAEDDWTLSSTLKLNAGVRFSLFNIQNKTYAGLEPRASFRWLMKDDLSFKASYARMNQYVHLISNSFISLPTDAWMPVTRTLKPLVSDQVSAGFYYSLNKEYNFSLEGYYKRMNNLLEYRDGHTFTPSFQNWEKKMTSGKGRSYGAELMAHKETGRLTGWVGYTLSWSDRKFPELNKGERYPARFDNRHKLNIVAMYKITPKVELSAAWSFASGNHTTLSLESYKKSEYPDLGLPPDEYYGGAYGSTSDYLGNIDYYEGRNNYQLPSYHRLDLAIKIYRPKKKGRMGIWTVSIYNVYSRMNPFMIYKSEKVVPDPDSKWGRFVPAFKQVGIMPIIPSISYTYKF